MGCVESHITMSLDSITSGGSQAANALHGCCVIIPALNPQSILLILVKNLQQHGFKHILLVDDGSSTEFQDVFKVASEMGATVLRHRVNLGKGAALKKAFDHAFVQGYSAVVTVDADGQHSAADAARIARRVLDEVAPICVLGVRTFASEVPLRSKFGNLLTRQIFRAFSSIRVSDTQTGLRGFSADVLPLLCKVPGQRYEFEMQMLLWLAESKLPIKEIPIDTIYIDGNAHSHFHPIIDSLRIYWVLFRDFFVSVSSFGIDIALFSVCHAWTGQVLLSTYVSRSISGTYNFLGNKLFVFRVQRSKRLGLELVQYVMLAVLLATVSGTMVQMLAQQTEWGITLCKISIDLTLYLASFLIQRHI
jgi:glycosyltransferase involved in cell wall biosynthesis